NSAVHDDEGAAVDLPERDLSGAVERGAGDRPRALQLSRDAPGAGREGEGSVPKDQAGDAGAAGRSWQRARVSEPGGFRGGVPDGVALCQLWRQREAERNLQGAL